MDFRIETKEFQKIISLLGVTAKVNVSDFSGQILIEANEDNTVLFVSNNNSTGITVLSDKVEVASPGSATCLYGKVKSFIGPVTPWNGDFGTKDIRFFEDDGLRAVFDVKHENGKKSVGRIKLDTFNDMRLQKPKPFVNPNFILNSNMFKKAVGKVLYAMDPSEQRGYLQGMNIAFGKEDIFFCGTNGIILSEYKVKNSNELDGNKYMLKYDFIMGLKRAVGEETQIFFEVDGRSIVAKFDNVCFSGHLVIGHNYPDYSPVLDKFKHTIVINKDALMSVITPFSDILDNEDNLRLTFELNQGVLKLSGGEASFECYFDVDPGLSFVIDVNGRFFYQTVETIDDDHVMIKFSDDKGVIIFDSDHFQNQKALITPIRRR